MISAQDTPELVVYSLFAVVLIAICVAAFGKKLGTKSYWLTGLGFGILVISLSLAWADLAQNANQPKTWVTGWIGDKDEAGAITVGVTLDLLGLMTASVLTFLTALLVTNFRSLVGNVFPERYLAASLISLVGTLLCWFALTPWIFFVGLALAIVGGFLAFSPTWDSPESSDVASRFGWERSWGVVSAILGAGVLASGRGALLLTEKNSWMIHSPPSRLEWVGAALLLLGLLLQIQPVTNVTWLTRPSKSPSSIRLLLNQLLPAWACFALLVRVEPQLREMGILEIFGWMSLVSALLSLFVGLFQASWISGFSIWVSAGLSLTYSALFFAGASKAYPMLLGLTLCVFSLNLAFVALDREGTRNESNASRALWAKISVFGAILGATKFFGFVGAGASLAWLAQLADSPMLLTVTAAVMFVFGVLGWRLSWKASRISSHTDSELMLIISPALLFIGALAIWWTGTLSGGVLPDYPDTLFHSALGSVFGPDHLKIEPERFILISWIKWGVFFASLGISFWISRANGKSEEKDPWQRFRARAPRFSGFLAAGYRFDSIGMHLRKGLIFSGEKLRAAIDEKVWANWVPRGLLFAMSRTAKAFNKADAAIAQRVSGSLKPCIEVSGKVLQLIQNGDIRWYVFFAIGMGVSILVHFFRIRG